MNHLDMHKIVQVAAGGFSAALTASGNVILWGEGVFGSFQNPQKVCIDRTFIDVQVSKSGMPFITTVDKKGLLYTWGANEKG